MKRKLWLVAVLLGSQYYVDNECGTISTFRAADQMVSSLYLRIMVFRYGLNHLNVSEVNSTSWVDTNHSW